MRIFTLYNNRQAIRNLIYATLLSLIYLVGKHYQGDHHTSGNGFIKIANSIHK